MARYIELDALAAEIERIKKEECPTDSYEGRCKLLWFEQFLSFIDTLEVKEFQKKKLYVVTRCEEHSDYVEEAFFSEKKAVEYCKQFEGNEDAYGRDITEIEVDCPLEVKEVDCEKTIEGLTVGWKEGKEYGELQNVNTNRCVTLNEVKEVMRCTYELGLKAQKGE